jgi:hypothetical protein
VPLATLEGYSRIINSAAFSLDGKQGSVRIVRQDR